MSLASRSTRRSTRKLSLTLAVAAAVAGMSMVRTAAADILYWDSNGSTAGLLSTIGGTWGTNTYWTTVSDGTGLAATYRTATVNTDDLYIVAGPSATSGNSGGTITVSGSQVANSLTFQASGTTTINGGTSITLGNGTSGSGGITLNQFAYGSTAQGAVNISTAVNLNNSQTWTNNSASLLTVGTGAVSLGGNALTISGSGNVTISGNVSGSGGSIIKNGVGTTTLSGVLSFTGGIQVNNGILVVSNSGNTSLSGGITVGANGIFRNTVNNDGALGVATNNINLNGGTYSLTNGYTFGASRSIVIGATGGTIDVQGNATLQFGGSSGINQSSGGTLTKTGTGILRVGGLTLGTVNVNGGTLDYTGSATLNGVITVNSGGIFAPGSPATWFSSSTNLVTVNTGGLFILSQDSHLPNPVSAGTSLVTLNNAATLRFSGGGPFAANRDYTFTGSGGIVEATTNATVNGRIISSNTLTKTGVGNLTLGATTNSLYDGGWSVIGGALTFGTNVNTGVDAATNSLTATGGIINFATAAQKKSNQILTAGSSATSIGGVGIASGTDVPTFTISGGPGVIALNANMASLGSNIDTARQAGWYLGANTSSTLSVGSLPAYNGEYRLGTAGATLTISNAVLTGTNNVVVGSPLLNGGGTVALNGANNLSGSTTVFGGSTLLIQGANGAIASSTSINLQPAAVLRIDHGSNNPGANPWNRISDSATITASGSQIDVRYAASATVISHAENIGTVKLLPGVTDFFHGVTSSSNTNAGTITTTVLFDRQAGGVLNIQNNNNATNNPIWNPHIGQSNGSGGANNRIVVTGGYTLVGGGSTGANTSIIPWIVGADAVSSGTAMGNSNPGRTFYTYDATLGLRPLDRTTEYTAINSAATTNNAILNAANASTTNLTLAGNPTINSLLLTDFGGSGNTILDLASKTLTLTSGALLVTNTGGNWTVQTGTLNFGTAEGLILVTGQRGFNLNANLSGSNGVTFYGSQSGSASGLNGTNNGLTGTVRFVGFTSGYSVGNGGSGATTYNIGNNNAIAGNDLFVGANARVQITGSNASVVTKVASLEGGAEGVGGQIRLNDGVGATNQDQFIIGASGTGTAGRATLDGGTLRPGTNNAGTDRISRIGYIEFLAPANGTSGLDIKSGTIAIDLANRSSNFTRVVTSSGVGDRIIVNGDINLVSAATLNLTTWSGSGVGPGSYLIATASGGVTNTTPLTVNSTGLGSTVRAKADYATTNQIWVDVINTANPSALAASVGALTGSGSSYSLDFGSRLTTDSALTSNLTISNLLRQAGITLQDGLKITGWTVTGDSVFSGLSGLPTVAAGTANGGIGSATFTSAGATAGIKSGTLTVNLAGSTAGWTDQALTSYVIALAGEVVNAGGSPTFIFQDNSAATINVLKGSAASAGTVNKTIENNGTALGDASLNSVTNLAVTGTLTNINNGGTSALTLAASNTGSYSANSGTLIVTPDGGNNDITVNVNVGRATAKTSGGAGFTAANLMAGTSTGAALSSRVTNTTELSLAEVTDLDAGSTITMNWRTKDNTVDIAPIFSDVVQINVEGSDQTYVLKMYYSTAYNGIENQLYLGVRNDGNGWWSPANGFGINTADDSIDGVNYGGYVFATITGDGTFAVIPEPTSLSLLGLGAVGLLARRRRK